MKLLARFLCAGLLLLVAASAPSRAEDPSSKAVVSALQPFVESNSLAGAVTLVADKDKVLAIDAVGYADVAAKTPLKTNAVFWIASMSKPITAAALMILVDEGKVKLDDPCEKYLPELKGLWLAAEQDKEHVLLKKPKRPPTIRDVLSHTSGMPFKSFMEDPTIDHLTLRDCVRSYAITPLQSEPGTKYTYSNAGINTAGRIIEVVSGMPFETFLEKRLFAPLGMKDTTFWPSGDQLKRLARSYKPTADKKGLEETTVTALRHPLDDRTRQPSPGGGLFSTAADCGKFCQMLLNRGTVGNMRVLSEDAVKELSTRQTGKEIKESYGLGFSVGPDSFGHGGAYATNMTVDTKRGLVYVFMVQHAGGFPGNGNQSQGAFRKVAEGQLGGK